MKRVSILGSTGSIGRNCLDVIRRHPERFQVTALTAHRQVDLLASQALEFKPELCVVDNEQDASRLNTLLEPMHVRIEVGPRGLVEAATLGQVDMVVNALVGAAGLVPTVRTLEAGKDIALANKESLVMAGRLIMELARTQHVRVLPVDSEHSAILQCLQGQPPDKVKRIILTASGGPFLNRASETFSSITPEEAVHHPTWQMGTKISIDSSTLMNKGLEVIEARWLFGVQISRIEVVVHPQSVVHSCVEFIDGSILAQMGVPDMRLPIQYALTFPERINTLYRQLDLTSMKHLSFEKPDFKKFPCLGLAYQAASAGGTMPAVLNAANEVVVQAFLDHRLSFTEMAPRIEEVMRSHTTTEAARLDDILEADRWSRRVTAENLAIRN